jgi:hypothetical protein
MGLFDEIEQQNLYRSGMCSIQRLLEKLDAQDKEDLSNALANPSMTHSSITYVLKSRGHQVSVSGVTRHRKGLCGCPR